MAVARGGAEQRSHAPRAEQGDAAAFRLMQHQAVSVGQRRVELRLQMAQRRRLSR